MFDDLVPHFTHVDVIVVMAEVSVFVEKRFVVGLVIVGLNSLSRTAELLPNIREIVRNSLNLNTALAFQAEQRSELDNPIER